MWLLPAFSRISRIAAGVYYRLRVSGEPVAARGTVLLVANHPNALLDPLLVVAAARRPVRFLAKAPLFESPGLGWLIRSVGSIPVYRKIDDPKAIDQNARTFSAVFDALDGGAAIGIFPEGISHDESALAPLKTGAARIALGAFARNPRIFPIVPVGLILRRKEAFRSETAVILGRPVPWEDLARRGAQDKSAVRELIGRIESGLRDVTLNLERWQDRPIVECAEAVWTAEWGADRDPAQRIRRLAVITRILDRIRGERPPAGETILTSVETHCLRLRQLRLAPADLHANVSLRASAGWVPARLYLLLLALVAVSGYVVFRVPYVITNRIVRGIAPERVLRSTLQFAIGIAVYFAWILVLALVVWRLVGPWSAIVAGILLPLGGLVALFIRERWRAAFSDVRRFFLLRSRTRLVRDLRQRQRRLAERLRAIYEEYRQPET